MIQINRGNATILNVNATGSITEKIMDANVVDVQFTLAVPFQFLIGDFIEVEGKQFFLNSLAEYDHIETRQTNYTLQFQSQNYELAKVQYQFLDANNELKEADFPLMANALIFMQLLVQNMNRAQSGWVLGEVIDSDYRNLSFSNNKCSQVLSNLAEEFETEWWIDGKTIHLNKRTVDTGLILQYGQGNGLCDISRKNVTEKQPVTRLYVLGGTKNIPGDYRNYSSRLKLPEYTGGYLEKNVEKYGVIEDTLTLDDVYPKREGTVSAVVAGDDNWGYFTDAAIDFDVNQTLLPGVTAKVTFNTGQLAGYTFEINRFDNSTRQFLINKNTDEKAIDVPSKLLRPAVGDKYVLTDINMPVQYISNGENDLLTQGQEYIDQNCDPRVVYSGQPNRMFFKQTGVALMLGGTVTIQNGPLGIDDQVRIISLTRDLNDLYNYTAMDLSESVSQAPINRQYAKQEKIDKAIRINNLLDPNRARNNWRTTQEALAMVFDAQGDYYTDKIKPLSIETTLLAVGAKPQQFELSGVVMEPNFTGNANKIRISAGSLVHFTIDDARIRTWQLAAYANDGLANQAYYLYARCNKLNSNDGQFIITTAQILVDSDVNYYHFLIGTLHTPIDGVRSISFSYGQTTVNGKFITTGKIESQDGLTYFDLDKGEIGGKITFVANNGQAKSVSDVDMQAGYASSAAASAVTAANTASTNAANAKAAADAATLKLANISSDNVLSAGEKGDVLKEKNEIQKSTESIGTQAIPYGIDYFPLFAANGQIQDYLAPLVADLTTDSAIDGPTFRNYFTNWYNERNKILKAISDTAKGQIDTVNNAVIAAQTNATNAANAANAAQSAANTANAQLADIASDFVLSVGEKPAVLKEVQQIIAEVNLVSDQAGKYGIYAIDYQSAFLQLNSYIAPLLADMTASTPINGDQFRTFFNNYYNAKVFILKQVSDTAKLLADNAQNAANYASSNADAAKTNAQNAANAAATAQTAANIANAIIINIQSDNVLSSGEKMDVQNDYNNVYLERDPISNQASYYGINPAQFQLVCDALLNYLNPLLADKTQDTPINGDQFRNKFADYYYQKIIILKAISDTSKNLVDYAQGSANYASSNADAAKIAAQNAQTAANIANAIIINIQSDNVLSAGEKNYVKDKANEIQKNTESAGFQAGTWGIDYNDLYYQNGQIQNYLAPLLANMAEDVPIDGPTFRAYFTNWYNSYNNVLNLISQRAYQYQDSHYYQIQQAAAQALNAQNTANYVNGITSFLQTTVQGNVIATGTLLIGDAVNNNAGITGVTDRGGDSVRMWAGATYANRYNANFMVTDNGRVTIASSSNSSRVVIDGIQNNIILYSGYQPVIVIDDNSSIEDDGSHGGVPALGPGINVGDVNNGPFSSISRMGFTTGGFVRAKDGDFTGTLFVAGSSRFSSNVLFNGGAEITNQLKLNNMPDYYGGSLRSGTLKAFQNGNVTYLVLA